MGSIFYSAAEFQHLAVLQISVELRSISVQFARGNHPWLQLAERRVLLYFHLHAEAIVESSEVKRNSQFSKFQIIIGFTRILFSSGNQVEVGICRKSLNSAGQTLSEILLLREKTNIKLFVFSLRHRRR